MTSFTPLGTTDDLKDSIAKRRSEVPVGIVIDRSCRVHISDIPLERIELEGPNALRGEFAAFGPIESYKLFSDRTTGRFSGGALCTFRNPADAASAIEHMDGRTFEDSVLKVTAAREHGVLLLHQSHASRRGFLPGGATTDATTADGKWNHDKYNLLAQGANMDEALGLRRRSGGRGGRGGRHLSRGERIDEAFNQYIRERDELAVASTASPAMEKTVSDAPAEADAHMQSEEAPKASEQQQPAPTGVMPAPPAPLAPEEL